MYCFRLQLGTLGPVDSKQTSNKTLYYLLQSNIWTNTLALQRQTGAFCVLANSEMRPDAKLAS